MIIGKNIKKQYGSLEVLKGVDLHIQASEVVSIVGSSGAGKTTAVSGAFSEKSKAQAHGHSDSGCRDNATQRAGIHNGNSDEHESCAAEYNANGGAGADSQ